MSAKIDRTVVRNAAYRGGEFSVRERHNERKNESYLNGDIDKSRADMNIHFRQNFSPAGVPETYEQTFNRLLDEGAIVKRGLKPDAKVFDELIFDVNTAYFENHGGYEYARKFFEEAYRCAVNEIGGEQYVLSAILHADERNRALSDELGRDVFHYHLHVVYVPVVEKQILWSKRTKDPTLIGTIKEVIPQISHSKKWPMRVPVERDGKTIILNAYSLLQDRFYEHMRAAEFEGFERGERGSTREHLSDLEYKTMKESERLADKNAELAVANGELAATTERIATSNNQLATLDKNLKAAQGKALASKQIERISVKVSRPMFGGSDGDIVTMSKSDWENVKKTALTQAHKDEEYRAALNDCATLKKEKSDWRKENQRLADKVEKLENSVNKDFMERAAQGAELHNLKNDVRKIP